MFSAAITSVIGSAYTSVSFIKSFSPAIARNENKLIIAFIVVSTLIFMLVGKPVKLLIMAGVVNGFILPVTLATILFAANKTRIIGDYKHPVWLSTLGVLVVAIMTYMSINVLVQYF